MSLAQRINDHISGAGQVCDHCIYEALKLNQHSQVSPIASALATTIEFNREKGACSSCGKHKTVTWKVSAPA